VSRHQLPTKNPRFEVFVGWAPTLQTYFAQVYDTKGEEEYQPFISLGADLKRVMWMEIIQAISPYAAVTLEIAERLVEDKRLNRA
jgi:hypothetical protein